MIKLSQKEKTREEQTRKSESRESLKRYRMQLRKNKAGITLVALVVTIVILLILAGITITYLLSDNGVFKQALDAKTQTEIAKIKEQIQQEIVNKQAENKGNISEIELKQILEKYGALTQEKKLIDKTLTTTTGNHKIKVSDIFNGKFTASKPYTLAEVMGGANSPNISGFNVENTYYVTWGTTAPYQINETSTINNAPPSGWSNYTEKQWANIVTKGGENDCYWVWIPRYAYKVPTKSNTAQTIEIAFLKDTGSTIDDVIDEAKKTEIETAGGFKTTPIPGNWVIHPAFTNEGNGGFGNLTGIWVAKFEASSSIAEDLENLTNEQILEKIANDGGSETDTELKVRVKPNVTSWRGITVNNIFTVCRNLTQTGNSLENTSNLNSHMMKNTEWGAVAYLSRSVYGKNGEVWNNPYYNNETNWSPITGLCGNVSNGKDNSTTDITKTCKYNETGGENASTTGNVYGVYDMAGGAWEYVAGILSNNKKNGNNTEKNNYYDFSNSNTYPNRYFDWYAGTSDDRNINYNANTGKYGDAVYETSSSGDSSTGSWDSSSSYFPFPSLPVLHRGCHANNGGVAGVFAFSYLSGVASTDGSFRPVVISSQS